jgi:hypothetical protein
MAKKPTEKQLYKLKNEWLGQFFEEVKPKEFYRAVFPEGSFERAGHFEDGKANGIITIVENDKAKNRIVFDDLSVIAYRKDWYCPVAGDRVKREGHCSEYEKSEIAKEK